MNTPVMLAKPLDKPERLLSWPHIVAQPKLDGMRCLAYLDHLTGVVRLYSRAGNLITSVPHINDQLSQLSDITDRSMILDGEIYVHGMPFPEIMSRAKRTSSKHADAGSLQFHIFDIVQDDTPQVTRSVIVSELMLREFPALCHVPTTLIQPAQIDSTLASFISAGYEGMILRNGSAIYQHKRTSDMLKIKPGQQDDYTIVGFNEEISQNGTPKNTLGAFEVEDEDGRRFFVGTGFTALQRADYWDIRSSLLGRRLSVRYQYLSKDGIPRHPVYELLH